MLSSKSVRSKEESQRLVRRVNQKKNRRRRASCLTGASSPFKSRMKLSININFDAGDRAEADRIAKYVEWQCQKDAERVTYLEKLFRTENVFGADYDCWNVRTTKTVLGRHPSDGTCIPGPVSQPRLYPLVPHRSDGPRSVPAKRSQRGTIGDRLGAAFRRWEQAAEALDASKESEEVQAVGDAMS